MRCSGVTGMSCPLSRSQWPPLRPQLMLSSPVEPEFVYLQHQILHIGKLTIPCFDRSQSVRPPWPAFQACLQHDSGRTSFEGCRVAAVEQEAWCRGWRSPAAGGAPLLPRAWVDAAAARNTARLDAAEAAAAASGRCHPAATSCHRCLSSPPLPAAARPQGARRQRAGCLRASPRWPR